MLYYLFSYLEKLDFPGARLFHYLSFRSALAIIISLLFTLFFGKKMIRYLQRQQIGEEIRNLGLEGQMQKKGTPTMGGLIIILAILIPTLLLGDLGNIYILLMIAATIWMGMVGFADDYIKVFRKHKEGLPGRMKILGQIVLGLMVGLTLFLSNDVVIRERTTKVSPGSEVEVVDGAAAGEQRTVFLTPEKKTTQTTIPFFKNNEFNYADVLFFLPTEKAEKWAWVVYVLACIFIVTAVSNGANLTDGLDGLATGISAIIGVTLGIFAYLSGNVIYADYLHIMYIPHSGELVVFMAAMIGATIGFLWYNSFPAQVFMGDTGSLALGGIIAVFAIMIRKELLIPILCGVFFVESISVMLQVSYFKRTKRKYGEGRRIFLMAPLHHHYQKKGYPEPKIVTRFWIIGMILAVVTIVTLKIR